MSFNPYLSVSAGDALYISGDQVVANVKKFGAKGDNSNEDIAAFQAAVDEAHALAVAQGRQAAISIPDGNYRLGTRLLMPGSSGVGVSVYGAGQNVTQLFFAEAGPGTAALQQAVKGIGGAAFVNFKDFSVIGPGQNAGLGGVTTEMDGVEIPIGGRGYGVSAVNFRAAIVGYNDHWQVHDCRGGSSLYGLYFRQAPGLGTGSSNQTIIGCNFSGNRLASIGLDPRQYMGAVTVQDTHFGFGPYWIYAEDASTEVGGSNIMMDSCTFITNGVESLGNGLFFDAGRHGSKPRAIVNNVFCGSGISGVPDANLRAVGFPHDYGIVAGSVVNNRALDGGSSLNFHAYMDLGGIDCNGMEGNRLDGIDLDAVDLFFQGSQRWVKAAVVLAPEKGDNNRFGCPQTEGFLAKTSAAVAKHRLLQQDGTLVKEYVAGSGAMVRGVSAAAGASGDIIPVVDLGVARVDYDADYTAGTPAWVQPSSSANGKVTPTGATRASGVGWARGSAVGAPGIVQLVGLR